MVMHTGLTLVSDLIGPYFINAWSPEGEDEGKAGGEDGR